MPDIITDSYTKQSKHHPPRFEFLTYLTDKYDTNKSPSMPQPDLCSNKSPKEQCEETQNQKKNGMVIWNRQRAKWCQ